MNNPASSAGSIAALALTLPYIPRQTYPIIHPVAQVGLSRLNYYADPLGLLVLLGPYLDQQANETGRLYLNGFPQPLSTDTTKDSTTPLEFRLPVGMLSNGINTLKVSVQRQSGNEDSAELIVLHYLADPAANDPDPTPGNSLLSIDVTPKSIGPTEAAAGVILTLDYPGKQLYDTLTVDVGGKVISHQIVPTPQDPNPETRPIIFTLYAADFIHAPDNPQFVFKYSVSNQVGDYSGMSSRGAFNPEKFWSKNHVVDVHLDRAELEMPILQEILGDNGDDQTIVDLDKMKGGPLWALIHLIDTIWQSGDQIHLTFEAWLSGAIVSTHDETLPIGNVPGQFSWSIPNPKVVAGSEIKVKYERIRAGAGNAPSKTANAKVIGQRVTKEDFNNVPVSNYGRQLVTFALTVTGISNTGGLYIYETPGNEVPDLPGRIDGRALVLDGVAGKAGVFQVDLFTPSGSVSFYYSRVLFAGGYVEFYDGAQKLIETKPLSITGPYNTPSAFAMSCNAGRVFRIIITSPVNNSIVIDNVIF